MLMHKKTNKTTWLWKGFSIQHHKISGEIIAANKNLAWHALQQKNIRVTSLQKKHFAFFLKYKNKINRKDIELFFRQLTTLTIAGIPLLQTIQMIHRNPDNKKLEPICTGLIENIRNGIDLSTGLKQFPNHFDSITCQLIHAGEKSGTLETMLERITTYREELSQLHRKIIQVLFYPAITISTAILITLIMLIFITPRFATLFANMHIKLPLFTQMIIQLGAILKKYFLLFILIIFCSLTTLIYKRNQPTIKKILDTCIIRIPLFGAIICKIQHAQFIRSLAILFAAGLTLTDALELLIPTLKNSLYVKVAQHIKQDILAGNPFYYVLQKTNFFPNSVQQLIEIGEESGTLEKMLLKAAELLETEINYFIALISQLIEPLIMITLGVLIGALLIAMYLPIFKLGNVI